MAEPMSAAGTVSLVAKGVAARDVLAEWKRKSDNNYEAEFTFQEVEMVAENLGSIPPNTAILIVTAGEKRYQLLLTSTTEKSARVRFVYEKNARP
jgi:hypothetical protein